MRKNALGNATGIISTHHLSFETKIRLLSQFGSVGKAEQMTEYYRGRPESLRKSTLSGDEYIQEFQEIHGISPERLETQT